MARIVLLLVLCSACSSAKGPVAVLDKADGPMQRQAGGSGDAAAAAIGTKFYLGDIVRATTGSAELSMSEGGRIVMQPRTAVRFVVRRGVTGLDLADGELTLAGNGRYSLELGILSLENGTVRVIGGTHPTLELVFGRGALVDDEGQKTELAVGKVLSLEFGEGALAQLIDAGIPDDASSPNDAAASEAVVVEVIGNGATVQPPGGTKWTKLAAGTATLAPGTRLRLDARTTARMDVRGAALELYAGARASVTSANGVKIDAGAAIANFPAGRSAKLDLPGGHVLQPGSTRASTLVDVDSRGDATVTAIAGGAQLIGKTGSAPLGLEQGASGLVKAAGTVAAGELVIPIEYDYVLHVGASTAVTIHDPTGTTAIRFDFATACPGGGVVEVDRDSTFRTPRVSIGDHHANLLLRAGTWWYRVRCTAGAAGAVAVNGRLAIVRDRGTRALPNDPPRFELATDGRNYRLDYQSRIPDVYIRSTGKGTTYKLHLSSGGTDRVLTSATGEFAIPGTSLREREYTFWVERDGMKSKVSTLRIGFDQTAAHVYIEAPVDGQLWGPQIEVAGATLPGWTVTIDGRAIVTDKSTRRFASQVPAPSEARAIAIELAHPERGQHVYLRRGAPK